jgi:hypothetical protein
VGGDVMMSGLFDTSETHLQAKLDEAHLRCPVVGDTWHERWCIPIVRVLMVDKKHVLVNRFNHSDKPHMMTRASLRKYLSYGSIPGTWAHVTPGKQP